MPTLKKPVKKVAAKKATKKVAAKKAPKKTVKKKPVKKSASKGSKTGGRKKAPTETHNSKLLPKFPTSIKLRDRLSLISLSPFRFPLDVDKVAIQTARVAGLAFVIIGAFFSYLTVQPVSNDLVNLVARPTEVSQLASTYTTRLVDSLVQMYEITVKHETDNGDREFEFRTNGNYDSVGIYGVNTINGNRVVLDEELTFVTKNTNGISLWHGIWHTDNTNPASYRLKLLLDDEWQQDPSGRVYSVIDTSEDAELQVESEDVEQIINFGDPTAAHASTSHTSSGSTAPVFTIQQNSNDRISLSITTDPSTTAVEVKAVESATGKLYRLGLAKQDSDERWTFRWNNKDNNRGTYVLFVEAETVDGQRESEHMTVTLDDVSTTESSATDIESDALEAVSKDSIVVLKPQNEQVVGAVQISAETSNTPQRVEFYVAPKNATRAIFIGRASVEASDHWHIEWNTTNTPNGDYELYAVAAYGSNKVTSNSIKLKVANPTTKIQDEHDAQVIEDVETATQLRVIKEEVASRENEAGKRALTQQAKTILGEHQQDLSEAAERLAVAYRSGDPSAIKQAQDNVQELKQRMLTGIITSGTDDFVAGLDEQLQEELADMEDRVARTESIVRERVGDKVTKDTDKDGVSDYDEQFIYHTNPLEPDTDSDGVLDGIEIVSGYDPTNSSAEAVLVYESPKEKGLVRSDILHIHTIETVRSESLEDTAEQETIAPAFTEPQLYVEGSALPNSFVTLYIFSTPVIVTVRTDENGVWNYQFDKELEDGEHELYVGMTDNTGKIVAKSEVLRFVKTAEAFSTVTEAATVAASTEQTENDLLSERILMFVLSLSVVIIGLILLLLGMHLRTERPQEHLVAEGYVSM
ncbi:hypothetical protein H6783_03110 [Candidatus Nomurabacteria bacterium]|nr:hypothetical protein [Candidatus Nomurabacteria bacterium]